jgi:hypothetical protein
MGRSQQSKKQQNYFVLFSRARRLDELVGPEKSGVDRKTVHQHHGSQEVFFLAANDVFGRTQKTEASQYGG